MRQKSVCSPAGGQEFTRYCKVLWRSGRVLCFPALAEEFTEFADGLVVI